jgi:hypothetical protein
MADTTSILFHWDSDKNLNFLTEYFVGDGALNIDEKCPLLLNALFKFNRRLHLKLYEYLQDHPQALRLVWYC